MQETNQTKHLNNFDNEIDIQNLFFILLQGKWIIFSFTALITTIGVIYSLLLPNIYESKSILVAVDSSNGISRSLSSYSGLAGLAGINLPSGGSNDSNSKQAIQKISSLSFFENNILPNINLPDLMAFKSWSHNNNELYYDESIYLEDTDTWVRDYSYPMQKIPSAQESYEVFINEHLSLREDIDTGFITLSIKHQSPYIAKEWVDLVINEVNTYYREKDKSESERASNFLNNQILTTGLSEIKLVLAELLKEETKKLSLIEANKSYVFDYIDPPYVMEKKSEPKRALIVIFSALFGMILSMLFVLIKHYVLSEKSL